MNETESAEFLESTRFWIQRVFVPIVVCMGVGGNTITVVVLTRKRMRCSTNIYLSALAVADILYLLFVLFLSFSVYSNIHDRKYELYWKFFGLTHWLCDSASSASVWLTVSFTLERYIAVCHPIKGKVLCTENRAKTIIAMIGVFCLLATLSTAFEYELAIEEQCIRNCTNEELRKMSHPTGKCNFTFYHIGHDLVTPNINNKKLEESSRKLVKDIYNNLEPVLHKLLPRNCTSHPHIIYVPLHSPLFNKTYLIDRHISRSSKVILDQVENNTHHVANFTKTRELVSSNEPKINDTCCLKKFWVHVDWTKLGKNEAYKTFMSWFSALCYALIPLVLIATFNCYLVHAVYKSQGRRRRMTNSHETVSMSNENRITVMLIGVVFLFLVCQTPTAFFLIYSNIYPESSDPINRVVGNICNFLVAVNAASNFIMYCILSKKYRSTFKSLFCERKRNRQDTLLLSTTIRPTRYSTANNGFKRNISEYHTPRNLETYSLTSIPRTKSLITRLPGKAKSSDLNT